MGGMNGSRANPKNLCSCRLIPGGTGCFYLGKKKELILGGPQPTDPKWRHTRESCGPVVPQKHETPGR